MKFVHTADAASDCLPYSKSFVYNYGDYATAKRLLESVGLNNTLSNLTEPSTLFVPTNEAFAVYVNASNITFAEAARSPFNLVGSQLLIVPGQYYSVSPRLKLLNCSYA